LPTPTLLLETGSAEPIVDDDARIMLEVAAGKVERFAELVERHQSPLFRVALSRLSHRSLAEEAVQETFMAAFRSRHTFGRGRPFRPWLWTIHKNACEACGRKERRAKSAAEKRTEAIDVDRTAERMFVRELLEMLPDEQSEAVRLRFFGSLTYDEIAEVQGCPTPTAKNRVRYALAKLAAMMDESEALERNRP
jgi:RNA polymerase sigma-70 factor, ECF subfamily